MKCAAVVAAKSFLNPRIGIHRLSGMGFDPVLIRALIVVVAEFPLSPWAFLLLGQGFSAFPATSHARILSACQIFVKGIIGRQVPAL